MGEAVVVRDGFVQRIGLVAEWALDLTPEKLGEVFVGFMQKEHHNLHEVSVNILLYFNT